MNEIILYCHLAAINILFRGVQKRGIFYLPILLLVGPSRFVSSDARFPSSQSIPAI
jgi:hypothetical protein